METTQRQFCRRCLRSCVPAVTLTFDGGTRRLHWCADHAADAAKYHAISDQAPESGANDCTCWATSRNGCPVHYDTLPGTKRVLS